MLLYGPRYESEGGNLFVSTATVLELQVDDLADAWGRASGKGDILFSVYPGTAEFTLYQGTFTFPEGGFDIVFKVSDKAGNIEERSLRVVVDASPPVSRLETVGGVRSANGLLEIDGGIPLQAAADDFVGVGTDTVGGSGIRNRFYLLNASTESCHFTAWPPSANPAAFPGTCDNPIYQEPFELSPGTYTVTVFSVDNLGNIEEPHSVQVRVRFPLTGVDFVRELQFQTEYPASVAVDTATNVTYVLHTYSPGYYIDKFDASGQKILSFGVAGRNLGQIWHTEGGIRVGPDHNLYVADAFSRAIHIFGPGGNWISDFKPGFLGPVDVDFDAQGRLNVLDPKQGKILRFELNGTPVDSFPAGPANSINMGGLAIDEMGNLLVADSAYSLVRKFANDGSTLAVFGNGPGKAALFRPRHVAIDFAGRVHVSDWLASRMAVFSSTGPTWASMARRS